MDVFNSIWEWICNLGTDALKWIVDVLPDSPFKLLEYEPIKAILPLINWFVPVDFILSVLEAWLVAVAGYYLYSVILRWLKAIE